LRSSGRLGEHITGQEQLGNVTLKTIKPLALVVGFAWAAFQSWATSVPTNLAVDGGRAAVEARGATVLVAADHDLTRNSDVGFSVVLIGLGGGLLMLYRWGMSHSPPSDPI